MSMQSEGKDAKGRNYQQVTDGSTSAASMGAGSTGDVGAIPGTATRQGDQPGNSQEALDAAGRTDDLLAGGSNEEQSDQGFQGVAGQQGSQTKAGTGNRQSAGSEQDGKR